MRGWSLLLLAATTACGFRVAGTGGGDDTNLDAPADTPIAPPSCLGAWCRRIAITVDGTEVAGGPHAGFPLLVRLVSPDVGMHARSDGADLVFTDADGTTIIPHDRRVFVAAGGELTAWVRMPSLGATSRICLYYGNAAATDQAKPTDVWSDYAGVWHLDEIGGTLTSADATANALVGSSAGSPTRGAAGKIGLAVQFDGIDDWLSMPDDPVLDATATTGTYSLWVKWMATTSTHYQRLMSSANRFVGTGAPDGFEWATQPGGGHFFYPWGGDDLDYNLGNDPFAALVWQHAAVTLDWATKDVKIYVNGVAMPFTDARVATNWTTIAQPGNCIWGGNPGSASGWFAGFMDELRATAAVRSGDWLLTEFRNQDAPLGFVSVGAPETLVP